MARRYTWVKTTTDIKEVQRQKKVRLPIIVNCSFLQEDLLLHSFTERLGETESPGLSPSVDGGTLVKLSQQYTEQKEKDIKRRC